MPSYNAVHEYEQIKKFESYLIIKDRIISECTIWLQEMLAKLEVAYKDFGTEDALMDVLKSIKN
jgi:hypothetical protein